MVASATNGTNGSANSLAPVKGGAVAIPTLLGRTATRFPTGGRIRAGIKVLTRKAAEHDRAREIYEHGVAAGKGFEQIEREISAAVPALERPLTPKNVPYFTVRGEDFANPLVAAQILEKYGEDRGEGRKLYRFPVVFPADAWQNVMPHELVAWTSSERRYWSQYSDDGQVRHCMTYEKVPIDGAGKRIGRLWGGRKIVLRQENGGVCDPEKCHEYQQGKCNLSGRFIFLIPGIQSLNAFELPTNSFYAMQAAIEKFQTIGFMRGGRISGFLDGQRTPFFISKRLVEVSRIDDNGRPTRVSHWLIELEAPIDVTALLQPNEGLEAIEMRAGEAAATLQGGANGAPRTRADEDGVIDIEPTDGRAQVRGGAGDGAAARRGPERAATAGGPATAGPQAAASERGNGQTARQRESAAPAPSAARAGRAEGADVAAKDVAWLLEAAAALGVDGNTFERFAAKVWGQGWKIAAGGRKRALDELNKFAEDPKGFQAKVQAELEVWA